MNRGQKCNIPKVSGCVEHVFLYRTLLNDFHRAANAGRLEVGATRIFLFGDISKALDRVQLPQLLHAIRAVLPAQDVERFLSMIETLCEASRASVTVDGRTVLVSKLGGVHQGDPTSPTLSMLAMEWVRRMIGPGSGTYSTTSVGGWCH